MIKRFNVRVYGILLRDGKVLVSDEFIKGNKITKFPGGGLEFGEGISDCVIREFKEELNLDVTIVKHFYTTDFFVASAFDSNSQVISVYYLVNTDQQLPLLQIPFERKEGFQMVRWIDLDTISDSDFTLIIDRKVGEMLARGEF